MARANCSIGWTGGLFLLASAACMLIGCKSSSPQCSAGAETMPSAKPETPAAAALPTIRIAAGSDKPFKDSAGNIWQPDAGFEGGEMATRDPQLAIANTNDPGLYRTEHWGMTSFSQTLPNGKYTVKLHFAETYSGVTGHGGRVFSFDVQGRMFDNFDIAVIVGGVDKAYVQTVSDVEVTDGKLKITFTPIVQSPEINGIEILPAAPADVAPAK
jgi:malectin (di-glucose binding ER protein)